MNIKERAEQLQKEKEDLIKKIEIIDIRLDEIRTISSASFTKIGRPLGSIEYTKEQIDFLEKNKDSNMDRLRMNFNDEFGTKIPKGSRQLYNILDRQGMIKPVKRKYPTNQKELTSEPRKQGKQVSKEEKEQLIKDTIELYKKGEKVEKIAETLNITQPTLYVWLKKAGIPKRQKNRDLPEEIKEIEKRSIAEVINKKTPKYKSEPIIDKLRGLQKRKNGSANSEATIFIRQNKDMSPIELRNKVHDKFGFWLSTEMIKIRMNKKKRENIEPMNDDEIKNKLNEIEPNSEVEFDPADLTIDSDDLEDL